MDLRTLAWVSVFALLPALAIPWFLWGSSRMFAGLPVWLWWHIGWMVLAAVVFRAFTRRAWGLGITTDSSSDGTAGRSGGGKP